MSAKSLAAHLTGLAWWTDHGPDERGLRALQRALDGRLEPVRPAIPAPRGELTVAAVLGARDTAAYEIALTAWARSAWTAYAPLHETARAWIGLAFA